MRFLFACGGTAGHINPAVGVAGRLRELMPDCEILFVGAEGKMETELVPREGYDIRTVRVSSISRSISLAGLKHNLRAVRDLLGAMPACRKILREFQPDVVIGTGGYVCYPVLSSAAKLGIPTLVHESNAEPGLTTRKLEKSATMILVGFEEARANYQYKEKVRVTGTPVRMGFAGGELEPGQQAEAKRKLGLPEEEPLVVSVWGSLGATEMNKTVGGVIAKAMENRPFRLIHSAGKRGIASMTAYMKEQLQLENWEAAGFDVRDYIFDMPTVMTAADLVLCRSGASTLAELTALGKPAVLVPSPNVVNNHQEKNARVLEHAGAACVIVERDASAETLFAAVTELLADGDRLRNMAENMRAMAVENATDEITSLVLTLAAEREE